MVSVSSMDAYNKLEKRWESLGHLENAYEVLIWDEAVMMPIGGGDRRAQVMSTLHGVIHSQISDPEISSLLRELDGKSDDLDEWRQANLREIIRAWRHATCLPADLVQAKTKASFKCEQAWRELRAKNNWKNFLPPFQEVVNLCQQEAKIKSESLGIGPYDALLDQYSPQVNSAQLDQLFSEFKVFLPNLIDEVIDLQANDPVIPLNGPFPIEKQKQLGLKIMEAIGFNFNCGRLDISHHPFCSGSSSDTRITTRYDKNDFMSSLMGIIHETGHAKYEQGLPTEWSSQPVGKALGMAIHESQSLLAEMQLARCFEFLKFFAPLIKETLGNESSAEGAWSPKNLFKHYTKVSRSYIRVDADELTYPLHIILRYEIEKNLIEGTIDTKDLPDIWDEKMRHYLGLSTKGNYKDGCMQDVHWPGGAFGYFPSYTLGAMIAAQLFSAAKKSHPNLLEEISNGRFMTLNKWLKDCVHSQDSKMLPDELLKKATGSPLSSECFKKHLISRYKN